METEQDSPYVLGIALSGAESWGGAAVFVSTDGGNSYEFVGMATGAATMGSLTSALSASADPDTTIHDLKVSLTISYGELDSFTKAQADANISMIAVDGELVSYETADLTGTFQYSLTYLRRGVYGTANAAHLSGAQFCVVDSMFKWQFPASLIGSTVHFKFCSVNLAGKQQEDISQVTDYTFTLMNTPRVFLPPPNTDFTVPSGNVLVIVTAITRDCTATLPPEVPDQGDQVTIQLSSDSTHKCIIDPNSAASDTIDGSSSPKTLDPGTGTTVWRGLAS
jgi:hypothetical protein